MWGCRIRKVTIEGLEEVTFEIAMGNSDFKLCEGKFCGLLCPIVCLGLNIILSAQ